MESANYTHPDQSACQKKVLTYEKQGRIFVYMPLVKENEYIVRESKSFLERFFDGDITAMVSRYMNNNELSKTDIENLRFLLSKEREEGKQ